MDMKDPSARPNQQTSNKKTSEFPFVRSLLPLAIAQRALRYGMNHLNAYP
jgi:hypothetical protein